MPQSSIASSRRVRVTTPLKAQSVETGESIWFPSGSLFWHIETGEETVRFSEIGGQGIYEAPVAEFTPSTKTLSR